MVKRLATYVSDMALDDFLQGTTVSLGGNAAGFEVGALIRIARASDESEPDLAGQLIWGAGNFDALQPHGWALWMRQTGPTDWEFRWDISTLTDAVAGVNFSWSEDDLPGDYHTIFLHGIWSTDITVLGQGAGPGAALYINGFLSAAANKTSFRPAQTPPIIGNGTGMLSGPIGAPRFQVAGTCYREGAPIFDQHFAEVYKRIQTADDIAQTDTAFQWDNIFSARRGFSSVTEPGQLWTDSVGGVVQLQRTGGGTSMDAQAANPHHWSI